MRTVTARATGRYAIWGSDAGGPEYGFGMREMLADEMIQEIRVDGKPIANIRRVFDDGLAIEFGDAEKAPAEIEVVLFTREEAMAALREKLTEGAA